MAPSERQPTLTERSRGSRGTRLAALAAAHHLPADAESRLGILFELLLDDPLAPTAIRREQGVLDDHLADSLIALECEAVRAAETVLDLGSGAGLPGLPLAIALRHAAFTLLESSARKCRFLESAVDRCGLWNVEVVHARAESLESGRERYDLVTVRAVASLPVVAEYAAPLLRRGGTLLAWHGRRDPRAEAVLRTAAGQLGLSEPQVRQVQPYPRAEHRHLYTLQKLQPTPARFPRRPGMALKRPLGTKIGRHRAPSDRVQR